MGGFSTRVQCPRCHTEMNPANLVKHEKACAMVSRVQFLFTETIDTKQLKRFRRSIESYGLTLDNYIFMYNRQNGKCAICNESCKLRRRLSVDHCHSTTKVRGLLCDNCNKLIGYARDNRQILEKALKYLSGL